MGLGKSHLQNEYTYGMPRRRKTDPNETSNHFSKQYWEQSGHNNSMRKPNETEYWMIESEKEYRQNVFQNKSENVYSQSNTSFRRPNSSFNSSFSNTSFLKSSNSPANQNKQNKVNNSIQKNAMFPINNINMAQPSTLFIKNINNYNNSLTSMTPNCRTNANSTNNTYSVVYNSY